MPDANSNAFERGPYKMRTIARMTDFSPALLRAWERRHALLHPLRGQGGHRLYTEEDLKVLLRVRELIRQGRSIGEIAGLGRDALIRDGAVRFEAESATSRPPDEPLGDEALGALAQDRDAIVDAALRLDERAVNRALDRAFARVSPDAVIFEVIKPATAKIGDLWIAGKCSVASEHLATGIFVHRLRKLVESAEPLRSDLSPVIVACFPDEYHQLGALIVAYHLCRNGLRVNFLGAALPFEDLESACEVIQPAAALLSVTRQAVYHVHRRGLLELAQRGAREFAIYAGGSGAPDQEPALERLGVKLVPSNRESAAVLDEIAGEIRALGRRRVF